MTAPAAGGSRDGDVPPLRAVAELAAGLDSATVLDDAVALAARLTGAGRASLLVDEADGRPARNLVTWQAPAGEGRSYAGPSYEGRSYAGHGRAEHAGSSDRPAGHEHGHGCLASQTLEVPVRIHDSVTGRLRLADPAGGCFGPVERDAAEAVAAAAGMALTNARRVESGEHQQHRLAALAEVQEALLLSRDSRAVLSLVAARAREVSHADVAAILVPYDELDLIVEVVSDDRLRSSVGARLPRDGTLCGEVMRTGRAVVLEPGAQSGAGLQLAGAWLPADTKPGATMLVPLRTSAQVFGVLAVAGRADSGVEFGLDEVALLGAFAGQAALALERAQAREDRLRLALHQDRERIARDLHDLTIQRLFGGGLVLNRLASRADAATRESLLTVMDDVDRAIADIRSVIHQLRRSPDDDTFLASLREVLDDSAAALGFAPVLEAAPGTHAKVPPHVRSDLLAVLREALSNVARHAEARSVRVALRAGSSVTLTVTDDGRGVGRPKRRSGLLNLRRRAEAHDGRMRVLAGPDGGTRLVWSVPATEPD